MLGFGELMFAPIVWIFIVAGGWTTPSTHAHFRALVLIDVFLSIFTLCLYGGSARIVAIFRRVWDGARNVSREIQSAIYPDKQVTKVSHTWPDHRERKHNLLQWSLMVLTLIHFVIVGRLVALTGGVATSPVSQFAFTMVVLGISTVQRTHTRLIFLGLGVALFVAVLNDMLGTSDPPEITTLELQMVIAIAINLLAAYFFAPHVGELRGETQIVEAEGIPSSETFGNPTVI